MPGSAEKKLAQKEKIEKHERNSRAAKRSEVRDAKEAVKGTDSARPKGQLSKVEKTLQLREAMEGGGKRRSRRASRRARRGTRRH